MVNISDFPFAWPPHQIMAWVGLERYGFIEEASRLAYRWVYLMTIAFVDCALSSSLPRAHWIR